MKCERWAAVWLDGPRFLREAIVCGTMILLVNLFVRLFPRIRSVRWWIHIEDIFTIDAELDRSLLWRLTSLMFHVHWITCNQLIVHNSTNDENYSCNVGIYMHNLVKAPYGVWKPYMKSKQSVWGRNKSRNWRIKLLREILICSPLPENENAFRAKKST